MEGGFGENGERADWVGNRRKRANRNASEGEEVERQCGGKVGQYDGIFFLEGGGEEKGGSGEEIEI